MYRFVLVALAYFAGLWSFDHREQTNNDEGISAENPTPSPNPQNILTHWQLSRHTRLILIADHQQQNSLAVQEMLHKNGYTTLVAENGKQAFASALRYRPDLILVDGELPILNGLESTHFLRKNPTTRQIPIIVMANGAESFTIEHLLAAGADATLAKPAQPQLLTKTITRLLYAR